MVSAAFQERLVRSFSATSSRDVDRLQLSARLRKWLCEEKLEDLSYGVPSAWKTQCHNKVGPQEDLQMSPLLRQESCQGTKNEGTNVKRQENFEAMWRSFWETASAS